MPFSNFPDAAYLRAFVLDRPLADAEQVKVWAALAS